MTTPGPAAVTAIVVTRDASALARECVESLVSQELNGAHTGARVEVVLVDCDSCGDEQAALEGVAAAVVSAGRNLGYTAAINLGARLAETPYVLVSNNDVVYQPGAVDALVDALRGDARCGAVAPMQFWDRDLTLRMPPGDAPLRALEAFAASSGPRAGLARRLYARSALACWRADRPVERTMLSGASMLLSRSLWESLGGFDERFVHYFDDADLCRRLRARGHRLLLVPGAHVVHHYNQTYGRDPAAAAAHFSDSAQLYLASRNGSRLARTRDRAITGAARAAGGLAARRTRAGTEPEPIDLGQPVDPPTLSVAGARDRPTLFLFSPVPSLVPAAGCECPTGEFAFPPEVFDRLAAGEMHACALSLPRLEPVGAWRWTVATRHTPPARVARTMVEAEVRPSGPQDADQIGDLFRTVFGRDLTRAAWHWKYLTREAATCSHVAEHDGRVVCHVGARRRIAAWRGEAHPAFDVGDLMTHPDLRGRGLWQTTVAALFERHVDGRALLVYGFPGEHARKLGEALQGWEAVVEVHKLEKSALERAPTPPGEVAVGDDPPSWWDERWPELEAACGLVVRRDQRFMHWRYTQRPDRRYRFLTAACARALAVVEIGGDRAHLMELFAEPGHAAHAARLVLAAEGLATDEGATSMEAWFPPWSLAARVLVGACGFTGSGAGHFLEVTRRDPRLALAWLADNFFYSLGDYDVS